MKLISHALCCLSCSLMTARAAAVEVIPDLSVGGFGRGVGLADVRNENSPRHSPTTDVGHNETDLNFIGEGQAWGHYQVSNYSVQVDLFGSSDPEWRDPDSNLILEQAFVEGKFGWAVVRLGRYRNTWLGWEGHHAPDLFRVKHSAAWDWNVQNHSLKPNRPFLSDGIGVRTPDGEVLQAEFNVVEDVLGDGDTSTSSNVALGGAFRAEQVGVGMIELGWAWDPNSTAAGRGNDVNAFAVDLNGHWSGLRDSGWLFAAEIQAHRHPELEVSGQRFGNDLILLGMVRYAITPSTACTVMVDWVDRGLASTDNEVLEYALSVTHRPHPRVRLDAEVSFENEAAVNADSYGAAIAATVELP